MPRPTVEPERDVVRCDTGFVATSTEPWLRIEGLDLARLAGRFVELTYRASLWDEPIRPLLRVTRADGGSIDHIATGPILGAGVWIGRLPADASGLSVSPTNRQGRFAFDIERVRVRHWPALLAAGLTRNRRSTRSAILTRLIGWRPESDNNLAWAIGATPLAAFAAWRTRLRRGIVLDGLDQPRFDWASAPEIVVAMSAKGADPEAARRTCASLAAQVFSRWRLLVVDGNAALGDAASGDARIVATSRAAAAAMLAEAHPGTLVGVVAPGDSLVPEALAYLAEQAHRRPSCHLFYGDAILRGRDGGERPVLLPGWSPRLQAARPYLRAPIFLRDPANWRADERDEVLSGALPNALTLALPPEAAMPLRRVMVETTTARRHEERAPDQSLPARSASVIIPTRDHPALLHRAIAAIRRTTDAQACEIVVVDNGSTAPEATALLARLRREAHVLVLDRPGPFNFSKMCNEAAAAARGDFLVFLNDDTEVLSAGWLDRLCARASEAATGAVGARLTYPDGRLQHVGVLLGMGGSAGHFGAPAPGDDPGWADRNLAVHEVSAVTGACLAVAREKFEAAGRFDEVDLPIELSDIDLCLKLNARGWQTIVDPAVHIMHEESASRGGATFRRLAVHDRERAVFLARWRHVLRDDPFFHPGLSLYSWGEALG